MFHIHAGGSGIRLKRRVPSGPAAFRIADAPPAVSGCFLITRLLQPVKRLGGIYRGFEGICKQKRAARDAGGLPRACWLAGAVQFEARIL